MAWLCNQRRNASPEYGVGELFWYFSEDNALDQIQAYAPSYDRFADNGRVHGGYGKRLAGQIQDVVCALNDQPNSRQAIIRIWEREDLKHAIARDKKDLPCTLTLQFLLRHGHLECHVNMRSNDVWLGTPYDVFCFTTIQKVIAASLGVRVGKYVHSVGSFHLYCRNMQAAEEAVREDTIAYDLANSSCHGGDFNRIQLLRLAETTLRHGKYCKRPEGLSPLLDDMYNILFRKWSGSDASRPLNSSAWKEWYANR